MAFIIGRGFAERQILKKWKWLYILNWDEYFDKVLGKHWYWQDLAQEIANWYFYRSRPCRAPNSEKVKMALSPELWRILWWNFAYTLILTRCSQWDCQMIFGIGRGFAEVQILKKVKLALSLEPFGIFDKILHTHYYLHDLDRGIAKSSPRDCKMTFNIGRGCTELEILKKWKWPNWVDCCDETLHTYWYWQDVAPEIVKCHLGLAEALPRFKFWKTVKLALPLAKRNAF